MKYSLPFFGIAWICFVLGSSVVSETGKIIGEGKFILIIAATPLVVLGLIQSLFERMPTKLPIIYAAGLASIIPCLFLVYRVHLGFTAEDGLGGLLSLCLSAAVFVVSYCVLYLAPSIRHHLTNETQQDGTGQPATRSESNFSG